MTYTDDWFDGVSAAWRSMADWLERLAPSDLPVHVTGETGSGKELVARRLHRLSRRRAAPFVALNCTALTESLLDAELFGAVRGAYTGAERDRPGLFRLAEGGTLLLDEVGDMPPAMQAKLLRVLQEGRVRPVGAEREIPVDVRLVTATHANLTHDVAEGRFRADLYYRLAVAVIRVPPLRERLTDLPLLVDRLGPRLARETGLDSPRVGPCAWPALRGHGWPGNVRELHAVLARAMLRSGQPTIRARHLGLPTGAADETGSGERQMILRELHEAAGCITRAAAAIGWTRQKLYRRMRVLAIERQSGSLPPESGVITSSDSSTFQ